MRKIAKVVTKQVGGSRTLEASLSMAAQIASSGGQVKIGDRTVSINLNELAVGESEIRQNLMNTSLNMLQKNVSQGKRSAAVPASKARSNKRPRKSPAAASAVGTSFSDLSHPSPSPDLLRNSGSPLVNISTLNMSAGSKSPSNESPSNKVGFGSNAAGGFRPMHRPPALIVPPPPPSLSGMSSGGQSFAQFLNTPSMGNFGVQAMATPFGMNPFEYSASGTPYFDNIHFFQSNLFSPVNGDGFMSLPVLPTPKGAADQPELA